MIYSRSKIHGALKSTTFIISSMPMLLFNYAMDQASPFGRCHFVHHLLLSGRGVSGVPSVFHASTFKCLFHRNRCVDLFQKSPYIKIISMFNEFCFINSVHYHCRLRVTADVLLLKLQNCEIIHCSIVFMLRNKHNSAVCYNIAQ